MPTTNWSSNCVNAGNVLQEQTNVLRLPTVAVLASLNMTKIKPKC